MKYYVYKITNLINGNFYIGKRTHKNPYSDSYMGSGKLIKEAISKKGITNFKKEIIAIFETNEEAAQLERQLVTKDVIKSNKCYNMHEGGHGGFGHINNGDDQHIERCRKAGRAAITQLHQKIKAGQISRKNMRVWDSYSAREASNSFHAGLSGDKEKWKRKLSLNNHMNNKIWCIPIGSTDYTLRKPFDASRLPEGWIPIRAHRDSKKRKHMGCYNKIWIYNENLRINKLIDSTENIPEDWKRGRKMEYY